MLSAINPSKLFTWAALATALSILHLGAPIGPLSAANQTESSRSDESKVDTLKTKTSEATTQRPARVDSAETGTDLYGNAIEELRSGDAESAAIALEEFLSRNPGHVKSMTNLARAYIDLDRLDEARKTIDQAVNVDSTNADAHLVRGRVLALLGETDAAMAAYHESIACEEVNPFAYNNLGLIYIIDGRHSEAVPLLEKATSQRQDQGFFYNNLGLAYEGIGNLIGAEESFEEALRIDADNQKALVNLARVQEKQQEVSSNGQSDAGLGDKKSEASRKTTPAKKDTTTDGNQ